MNGRWANAESRILDNDTDDDHGDAPYTTEELLRAQRADQGIAALYDELADIVTDRQAAWRHEAACTGLGPDLFFPERGDNSRQGLAVCLECPVTAECNAYANRNRVRFGMWGGVAGRNRNRGTFDRQGDAA